MFAADCLEKAMDTELTVCQNMTLYNIIFFGGLACIRVGETDITRTVRAMMNEGIVAHRVERC